MSLAELSAYARRNHLSVRLALHPGGPAAGANDRPSRLSELGLYCGPGKDADEIEAVYLGADTNLDAAARGLLNIVKRKATAD